MKITESLTLRWKIMTGVVLASALSVILASAIFVVLENDRILEAISRDGKVLTDVVAGNTKGALEFEDADTAMDALRTLEANSHIIGAVIFNANNDVFASYDRNSPTESEASLPAGFPSRATANTLRFDNDYLEISSLIESDGNKLGTIYIRQDLEEAEESSRALKTAAAIITLIAVVFSIFLALLIQRAIVSPINQVVNALRDIAEGDGDLTQRLQVNSKDELGELARWFNTFIGKIHTITQGFSDTSYKLTDSSQELSLVVGETDKSIIKQQMDIDQVASAITEMSSAVQEVGRNVTEAAKDAEEADRQAIEGLEIVNQTMSSIEELAGEIERASEVITRLQDDSNNIGAVLEVIGGIAEQTNLLALNAAIEAARAGEQGRGFAVVADEVRSLASRTQTSTMEIQAMIEKLQAGAKEAVQVMENGRQKASGSVEHAAKAGESLTSITSAVSAIKEMSRQIATASHEQASVTDELNERIISISHVANKTLEDSHLISTGITDLSSLAVELRGTISEFKL